jgi:hypothetical protein
MKKAIILFIISIIAPSLRAQNDTLSTPEKISEHFFMLFATDTDNAVDFLFSTNKWFNTATMPQLGEIKGKIKKLYYLGNLKGFELASKKVLSPSLVLITYIVKYDRQPIKIEFYYYKPENQWQIQTFRFEEDLKIDLQNATETIHQQ